MATIQGLYRKIQALNTEEVIKNAFVQTVDALNDENKKQLFEGYDKNGFRLHPYRNNKYARVKNEMNPLPGLGNPDFRVTGAFYNGIKTDIQGNIIHTSLSDSKSDRLLERDPNIIGLGGTYKSEFIATQLRPAFRKGIKTATGL